jgi:hypothetical protein
MQVAHSQVQALWMRLVAWVTGCENLWSPVWGTLNGHKEFWIFLKSEGCLTKCSPLYQPAWQVRHTLMLIPHKCATPFECTQTIDMQHKQKRALSPYRNQGISNSNLQSLDSRSMCFPRAGLKWSQMSLGHDATSWCKLQLQLPCYGSKLLPAAGN